MSYPYTHANYHLSHINYYKLVCIAQAILYGLTAKTWSNLEDNAKCNQMLHNMFSQYYAIVHIIYCLCLCELN